MQQQCFGFQKLFRVYEDVNAIILQTLNPKKLRTFFNQNLITEMLRSWFTSLPVVKIRKHQPGEWMGAVFLI